MDKFISLKNIKILGIDFNSMQLILQADSKIKELFKDTNLLKKWPKGKDKYYVVVNFKMTHLIDERCFFYNGNDLAVVVYECKFSNNNVIYKLYLR